MPGTQSSYAAYECFYREGAVGGKRISIGTAFPRITTMYCCSWLR